MEISAKVLREVEFSGSLRGYNTDEVDEFLEQVAVAVDALQAELRAAGDRPTEAPRSADTADADFDDSLRRTLVLAQRTADLAIKEAKEEAALLIEKAREEADTSLADAKHKAENLSSEAERRLREEVIRLTTARDDLKGEVQTLLSLLGAEKDRLLESLEAALRYVERSLTPSAELAALQSVASGSAAKASEAKAVSLPEEDGEAGDGEAASDADLDEVEAAIAADAAAAAPGAPSVADEPADEQASTLDDDPWGDSGDRPTLTALPSLEDMGASDSRGRGPAGWPA